MTERSRRFDIAFEVSFERRLKQFRRKHPDLDEALVTLLTELADDPFHPKLRLHPLTGKLAGLHAVSLTRKTRLTLYLAVEQRQIRLVDIGSHDEVYR